MAKKVKNPNGLLIVSASATEYAEKTLRMGSTCAMCNNLITSVCYVALIDSILCPDCMRAFVRSYNLFTRPNPNFAETNKIVNTLLK